MADALTIYLDVSKPEGALYADSSRTPLSLRGFYQGAEVPMRVYVVSDTGSSLSPPYVEFLPISALDLQVVVGGAAGSESILAAQYTWQKVSPSGAQPYFSGVLDLNTTALNQALGNAESYSTRMEFLLARTSGGYSGRYVPVHQAGITIMAAVKDPSGQASVPTPAPSYLTADQCRAMFVMWDNRLEAANAGRNIILVSPDGLRTRELGVSNEGVGLDIFT